MPFDAACPPPSSAPPPPPFRPPFRADSGHAGAHRSAFVEIPCERDHLEALLQEAVATEAALVVRGVRPAPFRCAWPEVVEDALEAYGWTALDLPSPVPSPRAVSRADLVLAWVPLIPLDPPRRGRDELWSPHGGAVLRKLVLGRAITRRRDGEPAVSWRRLGQRLGCSHEHARRWHAQGLDRILAGLWRPPPPAGRSTGNASSLPSRDFRVAAVDKIAY